MYRSWIGKILICYSRYMIYGAEEVDWKIHQWGNINKQNKNGPSQNDDSMP